MKPFTSVSFILIFFASVSACASAAPVAIPFPAAETISAKTTLSTASATSALTHAPTASSTVFPRLTASAIAETMAEAIPSQTTTPTLNPVRSTPPTIMLHRPSASFDSIAFLRDLLAILKQNDMKVITYRDIYNNPSITATEKGRLFIITIDDILLPYPMHADFLAMIDLLKEAGYPAVLGVVTDTDYADPQTATLLKELSDSGWEIATHTNTHANLGGMEKRSPRYVFTEISTSLDKIEKVTGIRPITLILPEGQMVNDARFIKRAKIYWCVGINGGITYDSQKELIYVGRESPAGTAEQTFQNMRNRFGF